MQLPSIIHVTDTHEEQPAFVAGMRARRDWILNNRVSHNIVGLIHSGDLITTGSSVPAWTDVKASFNPITAVMPTFFSSGNHDYSDGNRTSIMTTHLPQASLTGQTFRTAKTEEGCYGFMDIGGTTWLVIGLEWSPRDACVEWADTVLKAYPQHPAILFTHAFLYRDGTRYDWDTKGGAQLYNPVSIGFTAGEGIWDGERLWSKAFTGNARGLVRSSNIRIVLSGHIDNGAVVGACARLTSTLDNGKSCHQMVANYQAVKSHDQLAQSNGGDGLMRLLTFDYRNKQLIVRTIRCVSPTVYVLGDTNDFRLPLAM